MVREDILQNAILAKNILNKNRRKQEEYKNKYGNVIPTKKETLETVREQFYR